MFAETAGSRKAIGDVDILYHDGLYHLFHLVLPNHDFIAHAISDNAINWRRVDNALFIGNPGSWDDLMLWTMHVSADPHRPGCWRMFYTGLSRRDHGKKQRLGMAVSDDLFHWTKAPVNWVDRRGRNDPLAIKSVRREMTETQATLIHAPFDPQSCFPLEADPRHYESQLDEGRHWVSFRDPFYCYLNGQGWLLASGRVKDGPIVRRGCVSLLKEVRPDHFESQPALHHPGLYDDIEVPNLLKIEEDYYLIGSIREDAKIRYWHTDLLERPWRSYYDNVLLAAGNYAGRICRDPHGYLLWNFFSLDVNDRTVSNLMPPPKRLYRQANGQLRARTFEGFEPLLRGEIDIRCVSDLQAPEAIAHCHLSDHTLELTSQGRFHAYVFSEPTESFKFESELNLTGLGKCGLLFRIDEQTHDGYYLSLDLLKGVAQLRAWGTGAAGSGESMMQFKSLQSGFWFTDTPGKAKIKLIAYGSYIEFSMDGRVILSLADQSFRAGRMGIYVETATLVLKDSKLHHLEPPKQADDHLAEG